MSIRAKCNGCQKIVSAPDNYAGRQAKCPGCGSSIRFSSPTIQSYASPSASPPAEHHEENQQRFPCPFCAELILKDARKCRFCGEYLESIPPIAAPEFANPIQQTMKYIVSPPHPILQEGKSNQPDSSLASTLKTLPIWRILATIAIAGLHFSASYHFSGIAGLFGASMTLLMLVPLVLLSRRWCLFLSRNLWTSPVGWGVISLVPAFFKVFAPLDSLFFVLWSNYENDFDKSAYDWDKSKQWVFLAISVFCLGGASAIHDSLKPQMQLLDNYHSGITSP